YPNQQCETESDICWIDRLSGDRDVRLQLEAGVDPDEIIAGWADELAAFDAVAADYRLYQAAVSVEDVRAALDGYVAGGAVAGPLAHQLATALDQVERHLDDGRAQPAQRALDRFVRHLDNPKRPDTLTTEAADHLRQQALTLRASL